MTLADRTTNGAAPEALVPAVDAESARDPAFRGFVLGTEQESSSPLGFSVFVAPDRFLQLDDVVRVRTRLPDGREIEVEIASTRKVNWDSFQPNFFMMLSPGALDGLPMTYIASLRLEKEQQPVLVKLVRAHPSISVIDLDSILQQVYARFKYFAFSVFSYPFFLLNCLHKRCHIPPIGCFLLGDQS